MVEITEPSRTKVTVLADDGEYTIVGKERPATENIADREWLGLLVTDNYPPDEFEPIDDRQADDREAVVSIGGVPVSRPVDRREPAQGGGVELRGGLQLVPRRRLHPLPHQREAIQPSEGDTPRVS